MKRISKRLHFNSQAGNIGIIAAIFIVAALFLWQIWKPSTLSKGIGGTSSSSCVITKSSEITNIDYYPDVGAKTTKQYNLIKGATWIWRGFANDYYDNMGESGDGTKHLIKNSPFDAGARPNNLNASIYTVRDTGNIITLTDGTKFTLRLDDLGLLYVTKKEEKTIESEGKTYWKFNVYQEVGKSLPPELQRCVSSESSGFVDTVPTIIIPETPTGAQPNDKQIHMSTFTVEYGQEVPGVLNPHCKPVVYLYPQQKEDVSVKLNPKGFLSESIPSYPKDGWFVTAYPDGTIDYKDKTYPYLYYESKILDSETRVPQEGYVRKNTEMKQLFEEILPKLGLHEKEAQAFTDYWLKALPKAPYYFVGIMDKPSIDYIEPLTISPKPDTIIRVRTYFKALEKPIDVTEPVIGQSVERNGFSVVEWGGMVKRDVNHPFTCSE